MSLPPLSPDASALLIQFLGRAKKEASSRGWKRRSSRRFRLGGRIEEKVNPDEHLLFSLETKLGVAELRDTLEKAALEIKIPKQRIGIIRIDHDRDVGGVRTRQTERTLVSAHPSCRDILLTKFGAKEMIPRSEWHPRPDHTYDLHIISPAILSEKVFEEQLEDKMQAFVRCGFLSKENYRIEMNPIFAKVSFIGMEDRRSACVKIKKLLDQSYFQRRLSSNDNAHYVCHVYWHGKTPKESETRKSPPESFGPPSHLEEVSETSSPLEEASPPLEEASPPL